MCTLRSVQHLNPCTSRHAEASGVVAHYRSSTQAVRRARRASGLHMPQVQNPVLRQVQRAWWQTSRTCSCTSHQRSARDEETAARGSAFFCRCLPDAFPLLQMLSSIAELDKQATSTSGAVQTVVSSLQSDQADESRNPAAAVTKIELHFAELHVALDSRRDALVQAVHRLRNSKLSHLLDQQAALGLLRSRSHTTQFLLQKCLQVTAVRQLSVIVTPSVHKCLVLNLGLAERRRRAGWTVW